MFSSHILVIKQQRVLELDFVLFRLCVINLFSFFRKRHRVEKFFLFARYSIETTKRINTQTHTHTHTNIHKKERERKEEKEEEERKKINETTNKPKISSGITQEKRKFTQAQVRIHMKNP